MTSPTPLSPPNPRSLESAKSSSEGRRVDVAEYRELLVSRRSLVRILSSVGDVVGLRDTLTGETFLVDAERLFTGTA